MAHTVDEVNVLIKAQAEQFQKEINRVNSKLDSISTHAAKASAGVAAGAKGMGLKMLGLGAVVGAVSAITQKAMAAIAASTGSAIKRFDTLNNFPRVMQNLGISADTSQKSINYLAKKLEGLPTTLDEATTAVQRLTATNGNLRASTAIYLALNNAILAGGADAQLQASAMEQLQQAYSKGKPELQDWKTLMQAMPAQLKQIANAMGYMDSSQLYDALQNGRASMDDFMQTVVRLNKEGVNGLSSFEQQAAGATGGVATSFANMKNAIVRGLATCMDAIGQSNIAGFFNFVRDVISTASNYVAAFIKLVVSAINAIRALFGQSSIGAKNVESSGAKASDSMANVGKAAQGSTKDIGNTAKAAKKLQKQLAGFDEMNVLSKQDTSGSGGSGGGGGGSASPSYNVSGIDFDDSGISKGADKVNAIFEGIKKAVKGVFGGINFDNIAKSFKKLGGDIDKFFKPAKRILSDVWERIKPFINWAGNWLLPAFLNALGGAINFIGAVLGKTWDYFLKPFIDMFLAPIAHFTGGVIILVLNGIGEALRWIAGNQIAISVITGVVSAIASYHGILLAVKAVSTAYQFITGTITAAMIASNASFIAATSSVGLYSVGITTATTATSIGTAASYLLNTALAVLKGAFSALGGPIGIIAAAIGGLVTIFGIFGNKTDENKGKLSEHDTQLDKNRDGVLQYTEVIDGASDALLAMSDAELGLFRAEETQRQKLEALKELTRNYGISVEQAREMVKTNTNALGLSNEKWRELKRTVLESENANHRVNAAQRKVKDAQDEAQKMANKLKDEYDGVVNKMTAMNIIGDKTQSDFDKLKNKAKELADKIKETGASVGELRDYTGLAYDSGKALINGVIRGVEDRRGALKLTMNNLAREMQTDFRNIHGIHSPSKVFASFGNYIDEGLSIGIQKGSGGVISSLSELSDSMQKTLNSPSLSEISLPSLNTNFSDRLQQQLDVSIERRPIQVNNRLKIEIDGREIEARITELQNDRSFLQNYPALNF